MPLSAEERTWFFDELERLDLNGDLVRADREENRVIYCDALRSDESLDRQATDEELVRALTLCILTNDPFRYPVESLYIERYYAHGHPGSVRDEVDLIIYDQDELPFAMWDFKSPDDYPRNPSRYIETQLFGTAPLVGTPKLLVLATINPGGAASMTVTCIDRSTYPSYETWVDAGQPADDEFPAGYGDPRYAPFVHGGVKDVRLDASQADFRDAAAAFHSAFFGEHEDNVLFTNLMKCLLAKIYDERQRPRDEPYEFQVFYRGSREESAEAVFNRVNELYKAAYLRYIDPGARESDEINPREFPAERVKLVVKVLQALSITRGAALHGDVIGAFFEEILRVGFKQDKGMYFTHANLVNFMIAAVDLDGLAVKVWRSATHPENRLPYVIDPACGTGSFLLRSMSVVTNAIRSRRATLVSDAESEAFFATRMSDERPNTWAEHFIYGVDPKFVMAITAKVNMVLHGDGAAHTFKYDGLRSLRAYPDDKLKPATDSRRSVARDRYPFEVAETFDLVVSNPPFGITLSEEARATLETTFSLRRAAGSESLFLERWFQLLKPGGRLAAVVPESLLNTGDATESRLLLYRFFKIRAIVALPRNLFIETPTLTSLLFAQTKTRDEIKEWDAEWERAKTALDDKVRAARGVLTRARRSATETPSSVEAAFIGALSPLVTATSRITKKGRAPLPVAVPATATSAREACAHLSSILGLAGFEVLRRNAIFAAVAERLNYDYPTYVVDDVGFKLSKRRERVRPNQLLRFVGGETGREVPNLHLATEPVEIVVDSENPERILDYMRKQVVWS